jgi:ABC-type glycerol-3-phosphate transport system permease component
MREHSRLSTVALRTALVLAGLFAALPLYWLLLSSFKPADQLGDASPIPHSLTFANYLDTITRTQVPHWLLNSVVIAGATTVLGLLVSSLAAYSFARHEFPGKRVLFAVVLASLALPEYVTVLPQFTIMRELGLLNTFAAVILPLSAHALTLFLLRQYFQQLPDELFDAARLDGAGEARVFRSVALPLVRPGLGAAGLMVFLSSWNSYLLPLIMLRDPGKFTMPIGLAQLHAQLALGTSAVSPWATITAGTVLSVLPLVLCLLVMQRQFISGITQGAVK